VICAHLIWGAGLYLREIFPKARIIGYAEMYYRAQGTVMDFDPEFQYTLDQRCQQRSKNFTQLLSMSECDTCWSPTQWQASIFPPEYHSKIRVIHEGIDTKAIHSDPEAFYTLPNGRRLTLQDEVLTLINKAWRTTWKTP
jgi:hypothetical protein